MPNHEVTIRTGDPEAERKIAQFSPVSATPAEEVIAYTRLPARVRSLRILDIGAGGSNAVAFLLAQGADAYAVDPRYDRVQEIKDLTEVNAKVLREGGHSRQAAEEKQALSEFLRSYQKTRGRYRARLASNLPFEDNFFDIVYSVRAVTGYLDFDPATFTKITDECLRVTKPGGKIVFFPWETNTAHVDPNIRSREMSREQSHRILGEHLIGKVQSADIFGFEVIRDSRTRSKRESLVIVK